MVQEKSFKEARDLLEVSPSSLPPLQHIKGTGSAYSLKHPSPFFHYLPGCSLELLQELKPQTLMAWEVNQSHASALQKDHKVQQFHQ